MGLVFFVDVNGQPPASALNMANSLVALNVDKVILSGAPGSVGFWKRRLDLVGAPHCEILAQPSKSRRGEGTITLTRIAMEEFTRKPPGESDTWVVVSVREGFEGLAGYFDEQSTGTVRWVPAVSPSGLSELFGDDNRTSEMIRAIAVQMQNLKPNKKLLIAELANEISHQIPAMKNRENRMKLFGTAKFKGVCTAVGLKVSGAYVFPATGPHS